MALPAELVLQYQLSYVDMCMGIHVYAIHYLLHIVYKISAELVQYLLQLPCHVIFIRRSADAHSIDNKNRF